MRKLSKNYYKRQLKYSDPFPSQIRSQTPHLIKLPYIKKYLTNLDYREFRHKETDLRETYTYNVKNNTKHSLNTRLDRSTPALKNLSDTFSRSQKRLLPVIYGFSDNGGYGSISNDSVHHPNRIIPDMTVKSFVNIDNIVRSINRNVESGDIFTYDSFSTIKSLTPGIKSRKKKMFKYKSLSSEVSSLGGNLARVDLAGADILQTNENNKLYQNLGNQLRIFKNRSRKYAKFQNPVIQITRSKVVLLENKIRVRNALIAKRSFLEQSTPPHYRYKAPSGKVLDSALSANSRIFSNIKEYGQLNNRTEYINS